ncbi:MAG: hypothetical protein RIR18_2454 [Pseudomonadota bacterium]|jgi:NADH dehydrogenase
MDVKKVLLLGGSGFVGTYITNRLTSQGISVTIPSRRRERSKALIMLPNVEVVEANIHCQETLTKLVAGHDAVINLVGILHSRDVKLPYSKDFEQAHVELPKKIVAAMKANGVRRLMHMSALKADPKGCSEYLRSKGVGEQIVLEAQGELDVTVFRPSVIFGYGDRFMSLFGKMLGTLPIFPLGFGHARFQPVWVADVADAFVASLTEQNTYGKTYELVGPQVYTLAELVDYVRTLSRSNTRIINLSEGWAYLVSGLLWLSPRPVQSPDNLRSMQVDSVADNSALAFPGLKPTALEEIVPTYVAGNNPKGRLDSYRFRAGR